MISIIICSINKSFLANAVKSIEKTIGVPHEIIVIDNNTARLGICEAYNRGATKAKFDILCFMHEDISFETQGWGVNVITHLGDKSIGLIGVAGGDTKSLVPSSWPSSIFNSEISLIQHYRDEKETGVKIVMTGYPNDLGSCKNVACLDGVWMCVRKDIFKRYQFDAKVFTGFHGYDIDYSLQVAQTHRVCVIFDVVLHHYSEGSFDRRWLQSSMLVSDKWKHVLPYSVRHVTKKELIRQHWTTMNIYIETMIRLEYNLAFIVWQLLKYGLNSLFGFRFFLYSLRKTLVDYSKSR